MVGAMLGTVLGAVLGLLPRAVPRSLRAPVVADAARHKGCSPRREDGVSTGVMVINPCLDRIRSRARNSDDVDCSIVVAMASYITALCGEARTEILRDQLFVDGRKLSGI